MKNKLTLILILITVSLLFGLPHLLIPRLLDGAPYSPLGGGEGEQSAITAEEVYTYVPEVQEILEGRFIVRDTQLAEYKLVPSPFVGEILPAYLMAGLSILGGSTANGFVLADFLFPPLTWWLVYLFGRALGLSRLPAFTASIVVLIGTDLIALAPYPRPVWDMLVNLLRKDDFLFFSRNFHPQISLPFLVLALLLIFKAVESKRKKDSVIAGIGIGLQFYIYLFSWTALVLCLFLIGVWALLNRKISVVKTIAVMGISGFVVAFPYIVNMNQFHSSTSARDFFQKSSLPPRTFLPITARYIILVLVAQKLARKKSFPFVVITALIISAISLPEISNMTLGRDLEGKHWIRRILMPFSIFLVAVVLQGIQQYAGSRHRKHPMQRLFQLGYGVIIILVFQYGIRVQIQTSIRYARSYMVVTDKQKLFGWIIQHVGPNESVASLDTAMMAEIPAFSRANNVIPITIRSVASTDESLDRFLRVAAIYHVSPEVVRTLLIDNGFISRIFYFTAIDEGRVFNLSSHIENILLQYQDILRIEQISIFPYRLDYLLVGPQEKKIMNTDFTDNSLVQTVFQNDSYQLLRVSHE